MKIARLFPVFTAAYAVIYLASMYENLALASYFPRTRTFYPLTVTGLAPSNGPGMYWYGWLLTSALGGIIVAAIAGAMPARENSRLLPVLSWAVPLAVILVIIFLLRTWFIR